MDYVNAAYIFQQTVSEIGNTVMPKNKALNCWYYLFENLVTLIFYLTQNHKIWDRLFNFYEKVDFEFFFIFTRKLNNLFQKFTIFFSKIN